MSFREWGEVMDGKDMWQNWPVRRWKLGEKLYAENEANPDKQHFELLVEQFVYHHLACTEDIEGCGVALAS